MGHTFNNQFFHVVCLTKNLEQCIPEGSSESLYAYMGGIIRQLGGQFISRCGTSNHTHLLINTPTTYSISEFLGQLKACSSKWFRQQSQKHSSFGWSEGYLAFTVSLESIDNVKQYFTNEDRRHTMYSVENELVNFLNFHELAFKSQYLLNTTYTRLIYHLVWSVKNREQLLDKLIQTGLHENIKREVHLQGGKVYAIGNVADHIHILVECPSKLATANLVINLKTVTTHFVRSQNFKLRDFNWQEGFGVFSVGRPTLNTVIAYVNNQESHHQIHSFEQEWKQFYEANMPVRSV